MLRQMVVLLALMLIPLAVAENAGLRAGGATMGPYGGVTGVQTGPDDAVGVRYWQHDAQGDSEPGTYSFRLTTCYTSGSGTVTFCQSNTVTL